jgi:hypothetical protein
MKTVIYVLAGAIALSSVGCTAGRKERQAKAEPPSSSKAVAKTKTSAKAALISSQKAVPQSPVVVSRPAQGSKVKETAVAKGSTEKKGSGSGTSAKVSSNPSTKVAKVGSKPEPRIKASDDGKMSFSTPAVEAVAPLPRPPLPRRPLQMIAIEPPAPKAAVKETPAKVETVADSAKEEAPKPSNPSKSSGKTVASSKGGSSNKEAAKAVSKEAIQAELNKALADAGSDARAVVGSLVPTATEASKPSEKPPVVEDDAPSTSDTAAVVKSPGTMKSSDAGVPPAIVDSKGDVKEATASSKGAEPSADPKGSPTAAVAPTESVPPTVPAKEVSAPVVPKKPATALEKKEQIAAALREGNEALKSENGAKALELFESVVNQDKDQRDAWFRIGYLKEMSGDIQGAIKAFREVKRILAN